MKYLLDTHTYFWYRSSPRLLPSKILKLLTDTSHEMLISIATPWELSIKIGIGKLRAVGLLVDFENPPQGLLLLGSARPRQFVLDCCRCITRIRLIACWRLRRSI